MGEPYPRGFVFSVTYSNGWVFNGETMFWDTVGLYPSFNNRLSQGQNYTFYTPNQTVEVTDIKSYKQLANIPNPQGVIGLSFNTSSGIIDLNTTTEKIPEPHSIIETIAPNLTDRVVGLALQRWGPPAMDIGWWDPSRMDRDICWADSVYASGTWMANVESVLLGRNGTGFNGVAYTAVLDSKYPGLLLPLGIANAYFALVPGASQNVYPCATTLPSLTVILKNDCVVSIPGEALKRLDLGGGKCMMAVESSGSGSTSLTLGIPFFNIMYTVLNYTDQTVGVGQHAGLQDTLDKVHQWETMSPPYRSPTPSPSSAASPSFKPSTTPTSGTAPPIHT
jgi:hypothetical protein